MKAASLSCLCFYDAIHNYEENTFLTRSGLPCSGKSTAAGKLASWLEEELGKKVELVSEEQMLGDLTKNQVESQYCQ